MTILVAYGTKEGQSRRIARHAADRLVATGTSVELLSLTDTEGLDPARFDRVLLVAPVHAGQYPPALTSFLADNADALRARPTLLLSVSLAAAGHDAEDWRGLDRILADLAEATGFTPGRTEQVAGAYRPSRYDLFTRLIMRRIIATKDPGHDPATDKEYTDWPALDTLLDDWLAT